MADCEMPEYCSSPSLSGLNLDLSAQRRRDEWNVLLLDGKLAGAAILAFCFVDTAIGSTTNEADDLIALVDPLLGVISGEHCLGRVCRI